MAASAAAAAAVGRKQAMDEEAVDKTGDRRVGDANGGNEAQYHVAGVATSLEIKLGVQSG